MNTPTLNAITSPQDVKKLNLQQMSALCDEIRAFLIENVPRTGGHLSSNLGVVELTVALHRVFSSPKDVIVFDVGHQCYTHKLLTGRKEQFGSLRQQGGISGFPKPEESPHDAFVAGHGSTAISAAIGFARAKKLRGEEGSVVAIVGDGAFTGGMVYEALNNIEGLDNLVVILNDNKMAISKSEGPLARYFTKLRTNPRYYHAKTGVKSFLDHTPLIGSGVKHGIQSVKAAIRRGVYHSTFFEEMGFRYIGPMDGHDLRALCGLFLSVRERQTPLFVHVETVKGKGFAPAEQNPGAYHGVSAQEACVVQDPDVSPDDSFSNEFGLALASLAGQNKDICAITAAMKYGTGLQYFKKVQRDHFFDVGMAEGHSVTFAAGLAAGGMRPVVCLYSTFMQRAYDQLIHDVMLQNADVLFAIDRAGLVGGDGETHQGIYDAAFFSQQRKMPVVSVASYNELAYWLEKLMMEYNGPRVLRYAKGRQPVRFQNMPCSGKPYNCYSAPKGGAKAAIITYGTLTAEALAAAEELAGQGVPVDVYQLVFINPLPQGLVEKISSYEHILFAEEGICAGGVGEHLADALLRVGYPGHYMHHGVPETGVDNAGVAQLRAAYGLDAASLAVAMGAALGGPKTKAKPQSEETKPGEARGKAGKQTKKPTAVSAARAASKEKAPQGAPPKRDAAAANKASAGRKAPDKKARAPHTAAAEMEPDSFRAAVPAAKATAKKATS